MGRKINYLVVDVDGTMTDGGIYYDENGNELKKFCVKDGAGFFAARMVGIKVIVITGRECAATARRMKDINVDCLIQNVKNKYVVLKEYIEKNGIQKEELGYIGDDLNDLPAMSLAGFVGCPKDSCKEVKDIADFVSNVKGGHGAVRDVIEYILCNSGEWHDAITSVYGIGI